MTPSSLRMPESDPVRMPTRPSRHGVWIAILLASCGSPDHDAVPSAPPPIVAGQRFPPYPPGYTPLSVRSVGSPEGTYEIVWVDAPGPGGELWLARRIANTETGESVSWQFLDRTPPPAGGIVMFDGCSLDAEARGPLLVGRRINRATAKGEEVVEASIIDTSGGTFVPVEPAPVQCPDDPPGPAGSR